MSLEVFRLLWYCAALVTDLLPAFWCKGSVRPGRVKYSAIWSLVPRRSCPLSRNFSNNFPTKAAQYSKQSKIPTAPRNDLWSYISVSRNYYFFFILYLFFKTLTFIVVLKFLNVAETISMYKPSFFKIIFVLYSYNTAIYGPYTRNRFSVV